MAVPVAKHNFTAGELSPAMMGRQDTEFYAAGASTYRNMFVSYIGPAYSRGGTAFVGYSKQTGRAYPPRLIPFQFAHDEGLAMEVGHQYMRFISNGSYVTESPLVVTGVAQANPASLTLGSAFAVATATTITSGIVAPYAPGDTITLAGGTTSTPGVLTVAQTTVRTAFPAAIGSGYVTGNTIVTAGGTRSVAAQVIVSSTQVASALQNAGGSGGANGTATVTGTTGVGTKFQLSVTISGGALTAVISIISSGSYTTNPTTLTSEPVTGGGLTGATVSITMGLGTVAVTAGGTYTANPAGNVLTQGSTSGSGVGGTIAGVFAPSAVTVSTPGQYSVFPSNPVAQFSTSGSGSGATFTLTSTTVPPSVFVGDWLYLSGIGGMTALNNESYVVGSVVGNTVTLYDAFGVALDTTGFPAYTSGGSAARIYTLLTAYNEADIPSLKVVQSADTMSVCCVNATTGVEYAPQDLTRFSDTSWLFSSVIPTADVQPPTTISGSTTTSGGVNYQYLVTSISPDDGTESVASPICTITNAVNIAATAGSNLITWSGVSGVNEYYVYKALPVVTNSVQTGAQFGFAGFAYGTTFTDSNITADMSQSPPTHRNPFARGVILAANVVSQGSGYSNPSLAISSLTGSGAALTAVISGGKFTAVIVNNIGANYAPGDVVGITGSGTGAAITLTIGPQTGTYPSVPCYFQQRRGYANSTNNPDTYWFSKPGAFTNFDVRDPTISSDAITGSPWAVQVNGVQWLIQTSGGLLVMTGLRAWMLVGAGSAFTNVAPITPSQQDNVPQAFSGCSSLIEPVIVNYDLLYVDPNNVYYLDLPYQVYALSEPVDLTDKSEHLFKGYSVISNAYCEKPYRLLWSVRSDGALLSLTYYKTQKVQGWTRHDTQGSFVGCCSIIEPPVNALYLATQRTIGGSSAYMIERMDNRLWRSVEDVWAVDCGLTYPQPTPAATLTISSAAGLGSLTGATVVSGGSGYTAAASAVVTDQFSGPGAGAVPALTFAGGVLVSVAFSPAGSGYTQPMLTITDPAGSAGGAGATVTPTLSNATTLTASANVFVVGSVGAVVRALGGIARITAYISPTQVTANVLSPFSTIPNSGGICAPVPSGQWTMTTPVSAISGLRHLAGATVTGLADGNVITPRVVSATGTVTLDTPASSITVGLGYTAQFQDVPIDTGQPTIQAQRKKIAATSLRIEASRGVKVGVNQRDGSSLSPPQVDVSWNNLVALPDDGPGTSFPPKPYNAICTPLRTGDARVPTPGGLATPGQLCVQQDNPLPLQLCAIYSELLPGDTPQLQAPQKAQKGQQG